MAADSYRDSYMFQESQLQMQCYEENSLFNSSDVAIDEQINFKRLRGSKPIIIRRIVDHYDLFFLGITGKVHHPSTRWIQTVTEAPISKIFI